MKPGSSLWSYLTAFINDHVSKIRRRSNRKDKHKRMAASQKPAEAFTLNALERMPVKNTKKNEST